MSRPPLLDSLNRILATVLWLGLLMFALLVANVPGMHGLEALLIYVVVAAFWFGAVLLHELGHAVTATVLGWRIWMVSAGPVIVRLTPFSLGWENNLGGLVVATPNSSETDTRLRWIAILSAGAIVNFSLAAFLWWVGTYALIWALHPLASSWAVAGAAVSFATGLVAVWPFGEGRTDGERIFKALSGPRPERCRRALSMATQLFFDRPILPRAWPHWIGEQIGLCAYSGDLQAQADQIKLIIATSRGDRDATLRAARALPKEAPWAAIAALAEAYVLARFEKNPDAAEEMIASTPTSLEPGSPDYPAFRNLALAAVAAARPDADLLLSRLTELQASAPERGGFTNPYWSDLADDLARFANLAMPTTNS